MKNPLRTRTYLASMAVLMCATSMPLSVSAQAPAPAVRQSRPAEGAEAIAYSNAVQAYIFTIPLFIMERERARRENLTAPIPLEPTGPINQFGHLRKLSNADGVMPYSPNNDTPYSGLIFDLRDEPLVLHLPAVTDRYVSFQITDGYLNNMPYVMSSRVNGGQKKDVVLVGPNWTGKLPEGMEVMRIPTNVGIVAGRIRVGDDSEMPLINKYQDQMSSTSLSDWTGKQTGKPAKAPPARNRKPYPGDFGYFKTMADLLAESPPSLPRDAAMVQTLKSIGIVIGKAFNPDALDPAVRAGILRAEKDGPILRDSISLSRGVETPNRWRYYADGAGSYGHDYLTRAETAIVGLIGSSREEAVYLQTFVDGDGNLMNSKNNYVMHLTKDQIPKTGKMGFWSFTMYDAKIFQFAKNPLNRYKLGNLDNLKYNADGSVDLYFQSESPGAALESNWLPSPKDRDFKLTMRVYVPIEDEGTPARYNQYPPIKIRKTQ